MLSPPPLRWTAQIKPSRWHGCAVLAGYTMLCLALATTALTAEIRLVLWLAVHHTLRSYLRQSVWLQASTSVVQWVWNAQQLYAYHRDHSVAKGSIKQITRWPAVVCLTMTSPDRQHHLIWQDSVTATQWWQLLRFIRAYSQQIATKA